MTATSEESAVVRSAEARRQMQRFETDPPLDNVASLQGVYLTPNSHEGSPVSQAIGPLGEGHADRRGGSMRLRVDSEPVGPAADSRGFVQSLPSSLPGPHSPNDSPFPPEPSGDSLTDHWDDRVSISSATQLTPATQEDSETDGSDKVSLLQAMVFIEDAVMYRSVHHKTHPEALQWYRIYFSWPVRWFVTFIIVLLHLLAFLEFPSSLSWTSDILTDAPRIELPCGATEGIEFLCLTVLTFDLIFKAYFIGRHGTLRSKWLLVYCAVLFVSIVDWVVSISLGCSETVRVRRMLRPFFIIQNSSLMKKTFNCLRRTLPEVVSVLCLLAFHLYVFTLFGMLIFPKPKEGGKGNSSEGVYPSNGEYWETSNNTHDRNVTSMQSSLFRRRLGIRAAFEVLRHKTMTFRHSSSINAVSNTYSSRYSDSVPLKLCLTSMQSSLFRRRLGIRAAFEVLRHKTMTFRHSSSINAVDEGTQYFRTLADSLLNLLVLLTTANNPDVTMPAYKRNRLYEFYFMAFLIVGLYCFMNMLTAVIYNQFRGYFLTSMQSSLFRRRLGIRAAFEVLRHKTMTFRHSSSINAVSDSVEVSCVRHVVECALIKDVAKNIILQDLDSRMGSRLKAKQFQEVFAVLDKDLSHRQRPPIVWSENRCFCLVQVIVSHKYFTYIGNLIAVVNVVLISFELATRYDHSLTSSHSSLGLINMVFIVYYLIEQSLKVAVLGWRRYVWNRGNVFDGLVTIVLVVVEIFYLVKYGTPFSSKEAISTRGTLSLWNIVRITNILIMVRLFRIIPHIKAMSVVASTLYDLVRNMRSFGGILVAIYYSFAILGIELFRGKITAEMSNSTNSSSTLSWVCGSYQQLDYWANNFDDFGAAIVVLWDVMVVNNWHVFLHAYAGVTAGWSNLYFITWWLLSVVIVLNLFTAIILENFIMKWDRSHRNPRDRSRAQSFEESTYLMSVHEMFRDSLREPAENELLVELRQHRFLKLGR